MALTKGFKRLTGIVVIFGVLAALYFAVTEGYVQLVKHQKASVPTKAYVPEAANNAASENVKLVLPGPEIANLPGPEMIADIMAWNSQMGEILANGGPHTTKGSLMASRNIKLFLRRQDNTDKMREDLVAFAEAYKAGNPNPSVGCGIIQIMGDGAPAWLAGANKALKKLGDNYRAVVVGSCGRSAGEDQFMGPKAWKDNPESARGGVVSGYIKDGDWDIAMKWTGDNNIPNNPDLTTYDPNALNWIGADDFLDAAKKYIEGYSEKRRIVIGGKDTGRDTVITAQAVVTWTPGDVNVVKYKGGVVTIVSTREYSGQMPNAIIMIKQWADDHEQWVANFLQSIFEAGDMIKAYPQALTRAAQASAAVYKEETPEYWETMYRGKELTDRYGNVVPCGGSQAFNLADNVQLYGLNPGQDNLYKATYETFGDIVVQQYPQDVPSYPPVSEILITRFVEMVKARSTSGMPAYQPQYTGAPISEVVSKKNWTIEFETGSAVISPRSYHTIQEIKQAALVAENLSIAVYGHTDATGAIDFNRNLSYSRAYAVKSALQENSLASFPNNRFSDVQGFGPDKPIADNNTAEGRAKNRRVEIVLGR